MDDPKFIYILAVPVNSEYKTKGAHEAEMEKNRRVWKGREGDRFEKNTVYSYIKFLYH